MLSSTNVKISLALSGAILLIVIAFIFVAVMQAPSPAAAPGQERPSQATESVLQADTHILDNAGEGAVTLVEFLDFECEACGAFYPVVEDLGSDAGVGDSFGGLGREGLSGHLLLELDRSQPAQPVLTAATVVVTLDPENDR